MRFIRFLLPILFLIAGRTALAEEPAATGYQNLLTPLLVTGETVIGQPIVYPSGKPKITAAIVVIAPGKETGWHTHAVPLFASFLEGELTVDYGSKGVKVYKAGDTAMEAMNWPHNGMNKGTVPVRLLAVYIGADDVPTATPVKGPQ